MSMVAAVQCLGVLVRQAVLQVASLGGGSLWGAAGLFVGGPVVRILSAKGAGRRVAGRSDGRGDGAWCLGAALGSLLCLETDTRHDMLLGE